MLTPAGCSPGSSSSATPQKPTATPASVARPGCSPSSARRTTTHSGTEAISRAARLDGTSCSATVTRPLPPAASSVPTIAADTSWRRVMRSGPRRTRRTASISAAGDREPQPGAQQRRDGPHHDADRQVGRAPDHVDRPQAGPHLPRGRGERRRGRGALAHHAKASHAGEAWERSGAEGGLGLRPAGRAGRPHRGAGRARGGQRSSPRRRGRAAGRPRPRWGGTGRPRRGRRAARGRPRRRRRPPPGAPGARARGGCRAAARVASATRSSSSASLMVRGVLVVMRIQRSAVAGCEVDIQTGRPKPLPQMKVLATSDKLALCST